MIESRQIKDKVLDRIMEKFTTGQKLKRYDLFLEEEIGRAQM
jgi:hypothetical protein